jgi:hypothetical protein
MVTILVGTDKGLLELSLRGSPGDGAFAGREVTALGRAGAETWAVLDGAEVWRRTGGVWSRQATVEGVTARCIADTRMGVLVGTSEAHLFRIVASDVERVEPFELVDGRDRWHTPWGGPPDTRSISEGDDALFANVHVGGIVRTTDDGMTWEPTIDIAFDVHEVWAGQGAVFAACARGLAVSHDAGASWATRAEGLHAEYCRAVTVCGGTVLVTASTGPRGGRAAVYRGPVAGGAFARCRQGLPDWFDANIDSLCLDATPNDGVVAFGTDDGRVFASTDEGASWEDIATGLASVRCLLMMP